ncbi:bifunctional non-homologous end joining protein LigD [Actinokineospora alba]|uniref:Bifunctional non-homologous end joining protein LigD n=1 Tax=Actinokineospora alba TaxID=504798 RepID=A0A1H0WKQ2_9PSEU|nr:non-homologous end-joining DNA ligase [Actinokineospora alba]TDP66229.1 bifunctional non-homologous end joining protein LigD [Actinokineospora alba]SDJ43487.1 bifunctional non-homologous end joining protein LigD [Actinokineospora alba]SDP91294.1 bifunctional non-homologous end joining protein LigD [Actinokineospora alba]
MAGDVLVQVEGQRLRLSNLDKVLYPEDGFTKGEVIDYYSRIAPVMLPHLAERPVTFRRFPDGVGKAGFFEKNASRHAPEWVRTVTIDTPGSSTGAESLDFAVLGDLASLVWAANLAGLELHVPQWTVGPRGAARRPDRLVFDLDPGAPATIVECAEVALRLRELLVADGLEVVAKTSGSKGMQLYASVTTSSAERTSDYAKGLAERLEEELPKLVVSRMAKDLRRRKVFIDWSQNNPKKTTVAPYSLRARPTPTVSTPVTWDEVAACRKPADLSFTADEVLDRVDDHGDLFKPLLTKGPKLP